jgi:hypothetical protein
MVAVLLSLLHPRAHRTDGAGGDGGRDVHFPAPEGVKIYELKSFTGRMNGTRWRQIAQSLSRAAQAHPRSWQLVLPIDFTPAEERRFAALIASYSFSCDYHGLTWLDGQMAVYPVVRRYFLLGGADQVVELLREFRKEQAALTGGAPDLIQRLQRLSQRADEIDPFYRFAFAVDPQGRVSLSLVPRYLGAEKDRPITVTTSFAFPDSPEGRSAWDNLQAAIRYGLEAKIPAPFVTAVSVDAPAGFGGEHGGGELLLKGTPIPGPEFKLSLRLLGPDGRRIGSLPLTVGARTVGMAGLEATATDPTGSLRCRLRFDTETLKANIQYQIQFPPRCLPALALPTLTFLSEFGSPNSFQLLVESDEALIPATAIERATLVPKDYVELVAAFQRVQEHTRTYFDLPGSVTEADYQELLEADRLTQGGVVESRWTGLSLTMEVGRLIEAGKAGGVDLLAGEGATLYHVAEYESRIAGHVLPLGTCTKTLRSAALANLEEVRGAWESDPARELEIHLRPGSTDASLLQTGTPPAFGEDANGPSPASG